MANHFIVGDAGGTSTQWRMVKDDEINQLETAGFNAYTHDIQEFILSINQKFDPELIKNIPVFLYAAGVDTEEQAQEVTQSLHQVFGNQVYVANDLIGVARGLCGKDEGNVCILGTGSNACFYDGEYVNKVSASLGYILGDEGSGAYLGKKLMASVFRGHLAGDLIALFKSTYKLTSHDVINRIYHQPRPNHFLASFATFLYEHRHHPDIHQLIIQSFNDYFDAFFKKSEQIDKPFHFAGSIAYYFSDYLREVGNEREVFIKNIVQSPIAGLVLYHQKYE